MQHPRSDELHGARRIATVFTMAHPDWNARYAEGDLPWDTGKPDEHLVKAVEGGAVKPGRTLEIGCGTGTNALWLAARGFDVLAVDLGAARHRKGARKGGPGARNCRFEVLDFLAGKPGGRAVRLRIRSRHLSRLRRRRSARAASPSASRRCSPAPDGQWLSLIGLTDGRAARHRAAATQRARGAWPSIEPLLELVELRADYFETMIEGPAAMAWICWSRRRAVAAVPSTRR